MKNFYPLIFFSILIAACNNKADQPGTDDDTASVTEKSYSWEAILNDSSGKLEMKKVETTGPDTLSPAAVIAHLNATNSNIKLELLKTSGDTVYLKITDAMYLTQQMGSTGPTLYFAQAVYNLTEIPGFTHVDFDFEEGDHASPGTYNRNSFKDE